MNGKRINILVTGVGGNIGQGIVKAARMSGLAVRIIGTDMEPLSAGLFRCDRGYRVPGAHEKEFRASLLKIIAKEKVDILFVGSDFEIEFFAQNKEVIEKRTGCCVLVSPPEVIRIGRDKWETYRFCRRNGIPAPESALPESAASLNQLIRDCGFPLIVKPRVGYGSRNVALVNNPAELDVFLKRIPDAIVQEYLGDDLPEYTAAAFVLPCGMLHASIIYKRYLSAGATYKAEIVHAPALSRQVHQLLRVLDPLGPCNIQFRARRNKMIPFEFNIRYSGTTPIRAAMGFNDVEMALRSFVRHEGLKSPKVFKSGVAFRYWNEIILPQADFKRLSRRSVRGRVLSVPSRVLNSF